MLLIQRTNLPLCLRRMLLWQERVEGGRGRGGGERKAVWCS